MKRILTLLLLAVVITTGCTTAKMAVSDELKSSNDEYKVKGRNGSLIKQKVSFGDYSTTEVKRSWTKGSSSKSGIGYRDAQRDGWVNIISMEYIRKKQTVRFKLSDGSNSSEAYCVSKFNSKDLELGASPNSILNIGMDILGVGGRSNSSYYVQIFAGEKDDRPWEMVIDNQLAQAKRKEYIGYLAKSRTEYYSVIPVYHMETAKGNASTLGGTIGFEFRDPGGKPVAAVSLLDNGVVFLGRIDAKERFLLANACTALLLQQEIE